MFKKLILIIGGLFLIGFFTGGYIWFKSERGKVREGKVYKIGILQMTSELGPAVSGFQERLEELGYREGEKVIYYYRNSEGDVSKLESYAKEFVEARKVDLIYSLTTPATIVAKKATDGTGIPVVFNPVTDPLKANLVESLESSGNNLTGVKAGAYPAEKLNLLLEQSPAIKKIGVIYKKDDLSSGPEVEELEELVKEMDLELEKRTINSILDIPEAAESIVKEIDAFYTPNDGTVSSGIDFIIDQVNKQGLPMLASTLTGMEHGALLYIGPNYEETGGKAAELAAEILQGTKPSDLPIQFPPRLWIGVNSQTAQIINQPIAESILNKADYFVD